MDLFDHAQEINPAATPLADRLRPRSLDEIMGQEHLLGPGKGLRLAIESGHIPSMIFWGPPGTGKTTLAMLIAHYSGALFQAYSAVTSGIKELKVVLAEAQKRLKFNRRQTILFIDEIHRFNKIQQDAFLPHVEQGSIILIGATTENPSFEVTSALLSRCRVFVLKALALEDLTGILRRALADVRKGSGATQIEADEEALVHIAQQAHGDARFALNGLEIAINVALAQSERRLTLVAAEEAVQQKALRYDKAGDEHYNIISALHKSIRGSDPDAAVYWLGRMLEAGEDPRFLLRRMARMASEDIGLADPHALVMAVAAQQAFEFIGQPEGKLALVELAIYLALAPKSNSLERGYQLVQEGIHRHGELDVPLHIRNAPTALMKSMGYGQDYRYAHQFEDHWVPDDYLPKDLQSSRFYRPGTLGWEAERSPEIEDRLIRREQARKNKSQRPEVVLPPKKNET